jgi:hypothetical protein
MENDLKKIERRPIRYWFEDGIYEMAIGAAWTCIGFYFYVYAWIPRRSVLHAFWGIGGFLLIFFGFRLVNKALRALKQKWTYPRTGYVSYRRPKKKRFSLVGALAGGATPLIVGLFKSVLFPRLESISWYALIGGFLFAAIYIWAGLKTDIPRFFVLALISGVAGVVLSVSGLGEMPALGGLMGILGASQIISGAIAFRRHLRRHPSSGEERS